MTVVNMVVGARRAARLGVFHKLLLIDWDTPGAVTVFASVWTIKCSGYLQESRRKLNDLMVQ